MGNQARQVKCIIHTGVRRPQFYPVHGGVQGQVDLAAVPGRAQFVRRDCHRRKRGMGLGLIKSELFGQFRRDQVPERYVVDDGDQLDMRLRLFRGDAGGHIVGKHCDLGLEVYTPILVFHRHVIAGTEEYIGGAHIHQRVGPEGGWQLRPTRLAHQFHMGNIGAAVRPVVATGQGRGHLFRVEIKSAVNISFLQLVEDFNQGRFRSCPVV